MSDVRTDPIVVGVDGSEASSAAVRYAASEAMREEAPLHIVHVLPPLTISAMLPVTRGSGALPDALVAFDTVREVGERIVDSARIEAEKSRGNRIRVTTAVVDGHRTSSLLGEAENARMVVLGRADTPAGHIFTGRTFTGVAGHAHCPVIAVPSGWRESRGKIIVAIRDVDSAEALFREGFSRAAASGSSLHLIHSWRIDNPYEDLIFQRVELDEIRRTTEERIEAEIVGLRSAHPEVLVEIEVVHAAAPVAILDRSDDASLVILGRRSRHGYPGPHLGSTARAVLRHAACPTEVVPVGVSDKEQAAHRARHDEWGHWETRQEDQTILS